MSEQQVFDISRNWRKFALETADLTADDSDTQELTFLSLNQGEVLDRLALRITEDFEGDDALLSCTIEPVDPNDSGAMDQQPVNLPTEQADSGNLFLSTSFFGAEAEQGNVFNPTPRDYKLRFQVMNKLLNVGSSGDPTGNIRWLKDVDNSGDIPWGQRGAKGGFLVGDTGHLDGGNNDATYEVAAVEENGTGPIATHSLGNQQGGGFAEGDTFTLNAGGDAAAGVVDTVDGSGGIITYHLTSLGTGFSVGYWNLTATSGSGTGANIQVDSVTGFRTTQITLIAAGTGYGALNGDSNSFLFLIPDTGSGSPNDEKVSAITFGGLFGVIAVAADGRHTSINNVGSSQIAGVYEGQQVTWTALNGTDHYDIYLVNGDSGVSSSVLAGKVATVAGDQTSWTVEKLDGDETDIPAIENTFPTISMLSAGQLDVYAEVLSLL